MTIISDGGRLEDPSGLLVHQDKLQIFPAEAAKRLGVEIGGALFVDPLMLMVEVIVFQPPAEGFIDLPDTCPIDVLQDEVPLDEPEQAFDLPLCLGFPAIEKLDSELVGIPLIVGLAALACRLELAAPVREDGFR